VRTDSSCSCPALAAAQLWSRAEEQEAGRVGKPTAPAWRAASSPGAPHPEGAARNHTLAKCPGRRGSEIGRAALQHQNARRGAPTQRICGGAAAVCSRQAPRPRGGLRRCHGIADPIYVRDQRGADPDPNATPQGTPEASRVLRGMGHGPPLCAPCRRVCLAALRRRGRITTRCA